MVVGLVGLWAGLRVAQLVWRKVVQTGHKLEMMKVVWMVV